LGSRRDEVAGEWRRLHIVELHDINSSLYFILVFKSRKTGWTGYVACMGGRRSAYRGLVGKPEAKRSHGRPRSKGQGILECILKK